MFIHTIPIFLTALLVAYLVIFIWRRQAPHEIIHFGLFGLTVSFWSFCVGFETLHHSLEGKLFFSRLQYFGIAPLPVFWLLFCLFYTGRHHWLNHRIIAALFFIPAVTLLLVWTTENHLLFYQEVGLAETAGIAHLEIGHGPWFWLGHSAYSYLLLVLGDGMLIWSLRRNSSLFRRQTLILVFASLLPLFANLLYLLDVELFYGVDPTPVSFGLSSIIIAIGLARFRLFDLNPVAHQVIFENLPMSILVIDHQQAIVNFNPEAERLFGCTFRQVLGQPVEKLIPDWRALFCEFSRQKQLASELPLMTKRFEKQLDIKIAVLRDSAARLLGHVVMVQDVSEHKQFREMAYHDALTGLPNRRLFDLEAASAVTLANREGWSLALLYLDLDEFKPVNDRFGHEVGDLLLKQVAARLQMILRSSDLLARIGGDEFIVLLQHTNNRRTSDICDRILKTLAAPFNVEGHSIHIGISIGVALCPNHSTSLETLKSYADSAMYRAKTQKAGIDIYSSTSRHIANLAQNFK